MSHRHILLANVFFAPYSYGGATVVAEQVAQALVRKGGYTITAVSLCCRHDLAPYTLIKSEQHGITNYLINVPPGRGYVQMYDNPEVTGRLQELIGLLQPDLVHAHCVQDIGTGILEAAQAKGVPAVLSVHDFWWLCERQFMIRVDNTYCGQNPIRIDACKSCVEDFDKAKARFAHLTKASALAQHVTYPSTFAHTLSEASGFAVGRGSVWENGVHLPQPEFHEQQAERRANDGRLTFGFVGGPSQIKGWPLIRRAFGNLDRDDFNVQVVEGSMDGSWWAGHTFDDLPGNWNVHPRFTQARMDDFYAKIDVLLFMSQWKETFGLAIREALARGIKVIQTDSGGTTEHGTASPDQLIPIGAPAEALQAQLEATLAAHPAPQAVHKVASFEDQAAAFDRLVSDVLAAG
jgi:glycosyltransferase involved in cell wall biosynthesis